MTTIRDIAKFAGVSVATVSRALAKPELVRPKTIEKVKEATRALGYSPNLVASNLRRQRSDTVIVIVPQIQNPFFSRIIQGIENIAHDNGMKVLLGETQERLDRLDHYASMIAQKAADGLILLGSLLPSAISDSIASGTDPGLPLVLACERFEGLASPSVAIDNVAAGALATRHLTEQRRKRIATITGPADNTLCQDRLRGYREALEAAKLPLNPDLVVEGDFSIGSGYVAMGRLLEGPLLPDAVFCANDEMAIGAQKRIREAGLSMPQDIAIVGFDDIRFASYAVPPLTTIRQPTRSIGEVAMKLLLGLFDGTMANGEHVILEHELVIRESTSIARDSQSAQTQST